MSVLELAIFSIKSPHTVATPALQSALKNALQVLHTASGFTFDLLSQIEDPSIIYLLGSWSSIEAHKEFLVSAENATLLEAVRELINVDLMLHAQIDKATLPLAAPFIIVSRTVVKAGEKKNFEAVLDATRDYVTEHTKPYLAAGGWRADEDAVEEWVQFTGFQSAEQYQAFPKTEYGKMMEFVEKYHDLGHAKALDW